MGLVSSQLVVDWKPTIVLITKLLVWPKSQASTKSDNWQPVAAPRFGDWGASGVATCKV